MVLLGRAMVWIVNTNHRCIDNVVLQPIVWLQFAMQVLTEGCEPPFWEGMVVGGGWRWW